MKGILVEVAWLKDFIALTEARNFSKAADLRNVSQPAFSRRIRILEEEIGTKLIDRSTAPLSVTAAGEIFLAQAKSILTLYGDTIVRCREIGNRPHEQLQIAAPQSLFLTHFNWQLSSLMHPKHIARNLASANWTPDQLVTALVQSYCDLVMIYWYPDMGHALELADPTLDYITLAADELIPVTSVQNISMVRSNEVSQTIALGYSPASSLHELADSLIKRHDSKIRLEEICRAGRAAGIKAMILEGFGYGWLPRAMCQKELDAGRLIQFGGDWHTAPLEIRLYRKQENKKPKLKELWLQLRKTHIPPSNIFRLALNG